MDDTTGRVDTVTIKWTPGDGTPIYLIAMDSAFMAGAATQAQLDSSRQRIWPYDGFFPGSVGETPNFVPNHAAGWSATFPSRVGAAQLGQSESCKP